MSEVKRGRGRPKKNPYDDLPQDFKDTVANLPSPELMDRVAKVAMAEEENRKLMKEDQDLKEKKEAVKEASAGYREATAAHGLQIRYMKEILEGRGKC